MDNGPSEVIPINIGLILLGPVSMLIFVFLSVFSVLKKEYTHRLQRFSERSEAEGRAESRELG